MFPSSTHSPYSPFDSVATAERETDPPCPCGLDRPITAEAEQAISQLGSLNIEHRWYANRPFDSNLVACRRQSSPISRRKSVASASDRHAPGGSTRLDRDSPLRRMQARGNPNRSVVPQALIRRNRLRKKRVERKLLPEVLTAAPGTLRLAGNTGITADGPRCGGIVTSES